MRQPMMKSVDSGSSNGIIEPIGKEVVTRLSGSLSGIGSRDVTLS